MRLALSLGVILVMVVSCSGSEEPVLQGQVSGWFGYHGDWDAGLRYIPEAMLSHKIGQQGDISGLISLNSYVATSDVNLKLYRLWLRCGIPQLELRGGLQKINFGPARIMRSLMWFDRVDVRDPLELTEGVWGLLFRYYSAKNRNFWMWGLFGNEQLKGLETMRTRKGTVEAGGRFQSPAGNGELGLSLHTRQVDTRDWKRGRKGETHAGSEARFGIDGAWDLGIGVWFEGVLSRTRVTGESSLWQEFLTVGTDYTFSLGPGVHLLYEHFLEVSGPEFGNLRNAQNISALSVDLSLSLLDTIEAIGYYDFGEKRIYAYLGWQRKYDVWMLNIALFSGKEAEESPYSGRGILFLVAYNH